MKKIFVITYQAREKSDKAEYVNAFIEEAQKTGSEVRVLNLQEIEIDYIKFEGDEPDQTLSTELKTAQENIIWADQIVLVYPVYCMNVPAKLKAFVERVFQYGAIVKSGKMGPEPLLKNKKLIIIQSYGMPYFFMKYIYGDLPFKFVKTVFETWCGFKLVKRIDFDMIDRIDQKRKSKLMKEILKIVRL